MLSKKIKHLSELLSILLLCLLSCTDSKEVKTIGEAEYYFDEKLSSISADEDGSFWIGSETGDIFNFKDNRRISFDLGEDRIYKIKQEVYEVGDTIFWIGVRNSGLQKWRKTSNNKLEKVRTYSINFKKERYSPYDFVCVENMIYVATSQGIYTLDRDQKSDSLLLIYPTKEFLAKQNGNSFKAHNICVYNDSLLLVSTQSGVLLYNTLNHRIKNILQDHYIEHVSVYEDTIYSLSKNHLYLNQIEGSLIHKIKTGNSPKVYYQAQGIHYLIGAEELLLSNDLKDFLNIPLRRSASVKSRNIILPDTLNNFTYLLTENALWRIPNNVDVFKGNKPIKASCFNAENIYYLSLKNELYVQNKNDKKAKWIYTFPQDNLIQWMDISGDDLYFYTSSNKFQKMKISDNWIKNFLFASPQQIIQPTERITSVSIKNMNGKPFVYMGIQDGMIIIDDKNHIDTISELSNAYITSMFGHHSDRLYVSTLNDGVFYLNPDHQIKQVPKTENIFFIEDIITTNDHNSNLVMLTNQQIISQIPSDSLRVKGYKNLLYANDSVFYALPEFGFCKFIISSQGIADKGWFYKDIRFNPRSSFATNGNFVLGSNIGVLILSVGSENFSTWIEFGDVVNMSILHTVLIILIVLIITGIILFFLAKRQNATIVQIQKRKEDLGRRVDDLILFYSILDQIENAKILELRVQIDSIEVSPQLKNETNIKLEELSLQIAKLNRRVALLIPKKLEDQIIKINGTNSFDKNSLLKLCYDAQAMDDIELIKERVRSNETWLQERTQLFTKLDLNLENLSHCLEIEGVNKHLYENLKAVKLSDAQKSLTDLISAYASLEHKILEINSPTATTQINAYIDRVKVYLEDKVSQDGGLTFVLRLLNNALNQGTNIVILKNLKTVDQQFLVLEYLDQIKAKTIEYRVKHDSIIKNNSTQINKKFDKELAAFIQTNTQDITSEINTLISTLYNHLFETDKQIIDLLRLTNIEGQHARVLVLLIADLKIKRSLIPGMLGIYGNLNPVISRLISDRIRVNENLLKNVQKLDEDRSVFVHLILKLLD